MGDFKAGGSDAATAFAKTSFFDGIDFIHNGIACDNDTNCLSKVNLIEETQSYCLKCREDLPDLVQLFTQRFEKNKCIPASDLASLGALKSEYFDLTKPETTFAMDKCSPTHRE